MPLAFMIRCVAWSTTHQEPPRRSPRLLRRSNVNWFVLCRIVISEHQGSLPALNIVSLAVIRSRSCSIVVVARTNAFLTMCAMRLITTLVCELAALCIRCKRRRLREVVASRFNIDLTGVSACCIQDHHFDERFVSVLRGVVRFSRDC